MCATHVAEALTLERLGRYGALKDSLAQKIAPSPSNSFIQGLMMNDVDETHPRENDDQYDNDTNGAANGFRKPTEHFQKGLNSSS